MVEEVILLHLLQY